MIYTQITIEMVQSSSAIQFSTICFKLGFSIAAAIRSLSLICLFTEINYSTFHIMYKKLFNYI